MEVSSLSRESTRETSAMSPLKQSGRCVIQQYQDGLRKCEETPYDDLAEPPRQSSAVTTATPSNRWDSCTLLGVAAIWKMTMKRSMDEISQGPASDLSKTERRR